MKIHADVVWLVTPCSVRVAYHSSGVSILGMMHLQLLFAVLKMSLPMLGLAKWIIFDHESGVS
jgi:hypothetical protein